MATFEFTDVLQARARQVASATSYLLENYSWPNIKALTDRVFWLASQYIGDAPGEQDFYRWLIWQTAETLGYTF